MVFYFSKPPKSLFEKESVRDPPLISVDNMPRRARLVIAGEAHHITQRGNCRQRVFEDSMDYRVYLKWLREYVLKYKIGIAAYCLMPNHVHLILIPKEENSLQKLMNTLNMRYSQYSNHKREVLFLRFGSNTFV